MSHIVISGTGIYHPPHAVSNEQIVETYNAFVEKWNMENAAEIEAGTLEAKLPSSVEFIEKASGIKNRYLMDIKGVLDIDRMFPQLSDLAPEDPLHEPAQLKMMVAAAEKAMAEAGVEPSEIDLIVNSSTLWERIAPSIGIELQAKLGTKGFAYDMAMGCSSATFGISSAFDAINSGMATKVLVVTAEYLSPAMNYTDRDSHFIFGDAAVAMVIEKEEDTNSTTAFRIHDRKLFTEYSTNIAATFGSRTLVERNINDEELRFQQQGRTVFKELVPKVVNLVEEHLAANDMSVSDVTRMWLHQANINMNKFAAKKLLGHEASHQESPIILDEFANTGGAGLIIAFDRDKDELKSGDYGVICSFGAGYSIGSLIVERV